MMTMVDKYLATEMFEFNALSQFSIALFIYHGGWPCDVYLGYSRKLKDLIFFYYLGILCASVTANSAF